MHLARSAVAWLEDKRVGAVEHRVNNRHQDAGAVGHRDGHGDVVPEEGAHVGSRGLCRGQLFAAEDCGGGGHAAHALGHGSAAIGASLHHRRARGIVLVVVERLLHRHGHRCCHAPRGHRRRRRHGGLVKEPIPGHVGPLRLHRGAEVHLEGDGGAGGEAQVHILPGLARGVVDDRVAVEAELPVADNRPVDGPPGRHLHQVGQRHLAGLVRGEADGHLHRLPVARREARVEAPVEAVREGRVVQVYRGDGRDLDGLEASLACHECQDLVAGAGRLGAEDAAVAGPLVGAHGHLRADKGTKRCHQAAAPLKLWRERRGLRNARGVERQRDGGQVVVGHIADHQTGHDVVDLVGPHMQEQRAAIELTRPLHVADARLVEHDAGNLERRPFGG